MFLHDMKKAYEQEKGLELLLPNTRWRKKYFGGVTELTVNLKLLSP
jgi:hypothetical protein